MAKILLNYPSRGRLMKYSKTIASYASKSSGKNPIHFLIKVDKNDIVMNQPYVHTFTANLLKTYAHVTSEIVVMEPAGKIAAINNAVSGHDFDIVLSIADDMDCIKDYWDEDVVSDMGSDYASSLNYDSDPRLQDYTSLIVLPILGRKVYDQYGYIYHPDYKSEYCDNEQTIVLKSITKNIPKKIFHHDWGNNQDSLMATNIMVGQSVDRQTFERRKAQGFPK